MMKMLSVRRKPTLIHWPSPEIYIMETVLHLLAIFNNMSYGQNFQLMEYHVCNVQ
jgi:hypothetical protein